MPVPTWSVGQVLTSADVNNWFTPDTAYKTNNTTISSNTTLTVDPDLQIAVSANATYRFEQFIVFTSPHTTAGDLKWDYLVPSGAELYYQCLHNEGGATGINNSINLYIHNTAGFASGNDSTNVVASMWGALVVSSTSGSLQFRWAQQTSNAGSTTMRAPSSIVLTRIG